MNDMEDEVEVFFVDDGDTEWIPVTSVQPIHPSLLKLPFQAVECSVRCTLDKSEYTGDAVWSATRDRLFTMKVFEVVPSLVTPKMVHHVVELRETTTGKSLEDLLLQNDCCELHVQDEIASLSEELEVLRTRSSRVDLLSGLRTLVKHVATKSSLAVVEEDIVTLCSLLDVSEEEISLTVLQLLHGLLINQERVKLNVVNQCADSLISLLEEGSLAIVERTLHIIMTLVPILKMHLKGAWIHALTRSLIKWKKTLSVRHRLLETCAILVEHSSEYEQWKNAELVSVLCQSLTFSNTTVDTQVIRILLPLAESKTVAAEICERVNVSKFFHQLKTIQSLEHLRLVSSLLDKLSTASNNFHHQT